jgi:hypothetical protein
VDQLLGLSRVANGIAQSIARKLAAKPLSSLVETKRLMKKGQKELVIQQMASKAPASPACWVSLANKRISQLPPEATSSLVSTTAKLAALSPHLRLSDSRLSDSLLVLSI